MTSGDREWSEHYAEKYGLEEEYEVAKEKEDYSNFNLMVNFKMLEESCKKEKIIFMIGGVVIGYGILSFLAVG